VVGDNSPAQEARDWARVKKKRGDCSPLSFSFERKQPPSVLPGFTRKKLATTSLARPLRFSSRCRVKTSLTGARRQPLDQICGVVALPCRSNFSEAVLSFRALRNSSNFRLACCPRLR
jgi:hypothetical protein